jgi:hypothetical protein
MAFLIEAPRERLQRFGFQRLNVGLERGGDRLVIVW